jgi:hypothetical protein
MGLPMKLDGKDEPLRMKGGILCPNCLNVVKNLVVDPKTKETRCPLLSF